MSKKEKYIVYEYTCDLCQQGDRCDFWANNFNGGSCDIVEDGLNGKDLVNFEHLCRSCRKDIQDAVRAVMVKRGGDKWYDRRKTNNKPSESR